jgi:predicted GNAT family acetyltransferase
MVKINLQKAGTLGHLNLLQFQRESPLWSSGGEVQEESGILLYASASDFPIILNGVFRTDDNADPDAILCRANDFFAKRKRGYSLWIREPIDEDLAQASGRFGLAELLRQPEMVCTQRLPVLPLPDDVEIRRVTTEEDVLRFVEISASAYSVYGMPPEVVYQNFSSPSRMLVPHVAAFIAYMKGKPAATALTLVKNEIAGVYWVGTIEEYRKKGLAAAVVTEVTNAGFDLGACVNTLQATVMGEPLYKKLGYETVFYHRIYARSHIYNTTS